MDGILNLGSDIEDKEKIMDSRYTQKVDPIGYADDLGIERRKR